MLHPPPQLQQHLPFTVLKLHNKLLFCYLPLRVATALTVYGIETQDHGSCYWKQIIPLQQHLPFTVLKQSRRFYSLLLPQLQQHLPFTVLKQSLNSGWLINKSLQQHLPFTVLKPGILKWKRSPLSCNSTYRLRY